MQSILKYYLGTCVFYQKAFEININKQDMKNKMRFIIPKLIGVTLVVGLLSFVIGLLFKLLIAATILSAVGIFIVSRMRNKKSQKMLREHWSPITADFRTDASAAVRPAASEVQYTHLAIIPIH
jgi:hypothetical protein